MSEKKSVLLINPPISKPCEPPAGLARLAWVLQKNEITCRIFDASLEGMSELLHRPLKVQDTWSRRAMGNMKGNLQALKSLATYANIDRYKRAVMDTNRVLYMAGRDDGVTLSLSNYSTPTLLPVRSNDLIQAAEGYEKAPFFPFFQKRLKAFFMDQEPQITGISINYMSQALCAFAMAGFIKKHFPHTRIVLGGGLTTSWMNIPGFRNPFSGVVDDLVSGPGEDILLSMCGKNSPCDTSFKGFSYTPFPLERYLSPGLILPYNTANGCYWRRCAFCPEKSENRAYLASDPQEVMDDIHGLTKVTDTSLIHLVDNALSPGFLKHISRNPPGVPWYGFVRITPHLTDPDFVRGLKDSGCVMLKLGIESGDQEVLDALEKGIDLKTASRVLKTLKEASIATYVYLLFGTPAETIVSARKTLDFTLAHADAIDFLNLAIFNLLAHSQEAKELNTVDFYPGDLSLYKEFIHPKGWNRNLVRKFLEKEFKKQPAVRSILRNDPPFFTSNHAPFFKMPLAKYQDSAIRSR